MNVVKNAWTAYSRKKKNIHTDSQTKTPKSCEQKREKKNRRKSNFVNSNGCDGETYMYIQIDLCVSHNTMLLLCHRNICICCHLVSQVNNIVQIITIAITTDNRCLLLWCCLILSISFHFGFFFFSFIGIIHFELHVLIFFFSDCVTSLYLSHENISNAVHLMF